MRGGPVPGSARFIGGVEDLALVVSVTNVSRKRCMSGKTLCKGSKILERVRASHNWSSFVEVDGSDDCGALMVTSSISVCNHSTLLLLAVSIHSLATCRTSSCTCHWLAWTVGDKAVNAEAKATLYVMKNLRMRKSKIRIERDRERQRIRYIPNMQQLQITTTTPKRLPSHFIK